MYQIQGLSQKCLIENTTKQQRIRIIEEVRSMTSACGVCSGDKGMKYLQKYINGECELGDLIPLLLKDIKGEVIE